MAQAVLESQANDFSGEIDNTMQQLNGPPVPVANVHEDRLGEGDVQQRKGRKKRSRPADDSTHVVDNSAFGTRKPGDDDGDGNF